MILTQEEALSQVQINPYFDLGEMILIYRNQERTPLFRKLTFSRLGLEMSLEEFLKSVPLTEIDKVKHFLTYNAKDMYVLYTYLQNSNYEIKRYIGTRIYQNVSWLDIFNSHELQSLSGLYIKLTERCFGRISPFTKR